MRILKIYLAILLLIFLIVGAAQAADVWPDVIGHGTAWQLADAPGTGTPELCVINSLVDGAAAGYDDGDTCTAGVCTDYNGTGQTVYVGNARYCLERAAHEDGGGNPIGKVILQAIDGTYNEEDDFFLYLEDQDWTIIDFDPPGITTGVLWRNIKFNAFTSDTELTHLFIKDFRGVHGAGANGLDGGTIDTTPNPNNRKPMSLTVTAAGETLSHIVLHESTFLWGLDGVLGLGGESGTGGVDADYITVSKCLIAKPIAYDAYVDCSTWTDCDDEYTFAQWALIQHGESTGYYESVKPGNTDNEPPDAEWWREIEFDMTDRDTTAWKGITSESIDHYTIVNTIFSHSNQRNAQLSNMGVFNYSNNIIYNSASLGNNILSWVSNSGYDDWMKGSLVGNVAIGGEDSSSITDENFPTMWMVNDGTRTWYSTIMESGTADSGTTSTLTDSSESWGDLSGYAINLVGGTGLDKAYRLIDSNTSTVITIVGTWEGDSPSNDTEYEISDLSNHDIYIADNQMEEYTGAAPNIKEQDDGDCGTEIYDWDCVDNREEVPESHVKHTSVPTDVRPSGFTPIDDDAVETALLAQDGTGAGAYNDNQDTVTEAIFTEISNRTSDGFIKSVSAVSGDFPTISSSGAVTLDIPSDIWGLCDNGYYRIEEWLHEGDLDDCYDVSGEYNGNAVGIKYNSNAPVVSTQ